MSDASYAAAYPLAIEGTMGRFARETSYDAYVGQLVRQVLLISHGERINRPDFGAGLRHLVFAPNNPASASLVQTMVFQALQTWLGTLIAVEQVTVEAQAERLEILVAYTVRARGERRELSLEVTL